PRGRGADSGSDRRADHARRATPCVLSGAVRLPTGARAPTSGGRTMSDERDGTDLRGEDASDDATLPRAAESAPTGEPRESAQDVRTPDERAADELNAVGSPARR